MNFPLPKLTDAQVDVISIAIAQSAKRLPPATVANHRNYYFRELINSNIQIHGEVVQVAKAFQEEDAKRVVGYALTILEAGSILNTVPVLESI